jgi:hypothetical protein
MTQVIRHLQGIHGLAIAMGAVLTLVPAVPGSIYVIYVALVLLRPRELANELIKGRVDPLLWTILALIAVGIFIATVVEVRILNSVRIVTKIVATIAVAFGCSAVLVGALICIVVALREPELILRPATAVAQTVLGFSILWSSRKLLGLLRSSRTAPRAAFGGVVLGLIGSTVAAAFGAGIAVARGLEPSPFQAPHWFYVLAVPAVAAFGWATPPPRLPSTAFAAAAVLFIAATTFYVLATLGGPKIDCDMLRQYPPYYEVAGGYAWEPWRWKPKHVWEWAVAPGALTELSLLHIFDPVPNLAYPKGGYCPD